MRRFKNILVSPLTTTHATGARRTTQLAVRNDARVTMFGVVPEPTRLQRAWHRSDDLDTILAAERAEVETKLRRHHPTDPGVAVETELTSGNTALRIIEAVLRRDHDLVIVASDDQDADQATINRLFRKCPCPVWVIRPTERPAQRIMAAVNPEPEELELNRTILELASSLRESDRDELHLVHAWELYGESTLRHSAFMHTPKQELDALLQAEYDASESAVHELVSAAGLEDANWNIHLNKGPAQRVVTRAVAEHGIDVLVMGTVARTGISGLLIGNTAETVLDQVRCSVIAIKPAGFVTPIPVPESPPQS